MTTDEIKKLSAGRKIQFPNGQIVTVQSNDPNKEMIAFQYEVAAQSSLLDQIVAPMAMSEPVGIVPDPIIEQQKSVAPSSVQATTAICRWSELADAVMLTQSA